MTIYWVTDQPFPASDEVTAEAAQAGADVILHGIPPALVDLITPGTLGAVDIPDPDPAPAVGPTPEQLATLAAVLIDNAADLSAAVAAVAGSNTAKAALQVINEAVQTAAADS